MSNTIQSLTNIISSQSNSLNKLLTGLDPAALVAISKLPPKEKIEALSKLVNLDRSAANNILRLKGINGK